MKKKSPGGGGRQGLLAPQGGKEKEGGVKRGGVEKGGRDQFTLLITGHVSTETEIMEKKNGREERGKEGEKKDALLQATWWLVATERGERGEKNQKKRKRDPGITLMVDAIVCRAIDGKKKKKKLKKGGGGRQCRGFDLRRVGLEVPTEKGRDKTTCSKRLPPNTGGDQTLSLRKASTHMGE